MNSSTLKAQSLSSSLGETQLDPFIKDFVSISLNQQEFAAKANNAVTLVFDQPSSLPTRTQYSLAALMQYVCQSLTAMLLDKGEQQLPNSHAETIEVFNCYLL